MGIGQASLAGDNLAGVVDVVRHLITSFLVMAGHIPSRAFHVQNSIDLSVCDFSG